MSRQHVRSCSEVGTTSRAAQIDAERLPRLGGPTMRHGFTLVELLVVIAIIGTLMALLLPAVQRARESSRRSSCLNSIRQLAIATMHFEDRYRRYPGALDEMPIQLRASQTSERFTTWAVLLLPDLEREQIFNLYAEGHQPLPGAYIEPYLCPSDASKLRTGSAMSYVANAGWGVSAAFQKPANGPFLNRIYQPKIATFDGHWRDGREYTLIYTENRDAENYDVLGWNGLGSEPNDASEDACDLDYIGEGNDRLWSPVFVWHSNDQNRSIHINAPDPGPCHTAAPILIDDTGRYVGGSGSLECVTLYSMRARPSSYHSGGVNVAFGSGRALFLRENINYNVFRALMTLSDKDSDSPHPDFVVEDQPYL